MYERNIYLLDVEERKGDRLPDVIAVLACHLEVFVPFLLDHGVVLYRHRVPHEVLLQAQTETSQNPTVMSPTSINVI